MAIFASTSAAAHEPNDFVTPNFEQAIPNLPGKSLIAVEVEYPPGGASVPHVHAKSTFIYAYVISGAVESKVNDGKMRAYHAGDSWSEPPGASHTVSRNRPDEHTYEIQSLKSISYAVFCLKKK